MSKVLIIEDDIFLTEVLEKKMNDAGYAVEIARDGGVGLTKLKQDKPDIVLLDLALPVKGGFEILEEKMRDASIRSIPVIVISNSGQPLEIDRVLALNVKDYFVKAQFDPDEVLAKVKLQLRDMDAVASLGDDEKKTEKEHTASLASKKIMWVEDDVFLSDIIARKLSNEGSKLIHAANGNDVFDMAKKEKPDVILLDILLPGKDGFHVLEQLKAVSETKEIPVILLSNLGQKSDIEKGEKLGAARFLVKATVTLDEIVDEIKKFAKVSK
ncbi:MAG TPA: response regulator [Candidatus Paceibacterota bacterium]